VCRIGYTPTGPEDYQPSTLYGESKVRTEQLWREADGAGREWVLVRPTTIWGPGMNPHYLRFFAMVRDGRYFHVGRGPTYKSYGYVRNVVHEYVQLLQAPADQVHRRVFYVADYEPLSLEAWADAFQLALGARAIPHMPAVAAVAAARLGDLIQRAGWSSFPFTSFRLNNVRTSYRVDLSATRTVCGPLPFTWVEGVGETVSWLREVWTRDAERAAMPARR
jgi:nucleoside-diphosphate-sugar epimerase